MSPTRCARAKNFPFSPDHPPHKNLTILSTHTPTAVATPFLNLLVLLQPAAPGGAGARSASGTVMRNRTLADAVASSFSGDKIEPFQKLGGCLDATWRFPSLRRCSEAAPALLKL